MKNPLITIKEIYKKKERQEIGEKFIEIMEIIYAIILACGVVKIVEVFQWDIPLDRWLSILIAVFVLIRFFFAPSKNIKILVKKGIGWKWSIMPYDVLILITHSFIYYCMCLKIQEIEIFYLYFFILLFVNSSWLFTIWFRLKNEKITYIKIWAISNLIFSGVYFVTSIIGLKFWLLWFVLALLNSLIDLFITYPDYFQD